MAANVPWRLSSFIFRLRFWVEGISPGFLILPNMGSRPKICPHWDGQLFAALGIFERQHEKAVPGCGRHSLA